MQMQPWLLNDGKKRLVAATETAPKAQGRNG